MILLIGFFLGNVARVDTKKCSKCLVIREMFWFSKNGAERDGKCGICKECQRAARGVKLQRPLRHHMLDVPGAVSFRQKQPFRRRRGSISQAEWFAKTTPLRREKWWAKKEAKANAVTQRKNRISLMMAERRTHKERHRFYANFFPRHCQHHPEIQLKLFSGKRKCPQCRSEQKLQYRKTDAGREAIRSAKKARKHRQRGGGRLLAADVRRLFILYPACLACGSTKELALEHIVALARGGTNAFENLQVLCNICNSKKGVTTIDYRPRISYETG